MTTFIQKYSGVEPEIQVQLFSSFAIIVILWILRKLTIRFIIDRIENNRDRYQWTKGIKSASVLLGVIMLSRVWFGIFEQIGTFLGLVSAGLAIAMKDLLVNMGGWIFIKIRKPFEIGDRIQIDNVVGDVIDIRIFQFSVMEVGNWVHADQVTGRIIHLPNGFVFSKWLASYTAGFEYIWDEIPVLLTFESDYKTAKKILQKAAKVHAMSLTPWAEIQIKEASKKYLIGETNLEPTVFTSVQDSGVLLTMRYICHARERRAIAEKIWEEVLDRFATQPHIDFAYPTTRFYSNTTEGKPPHVTRVDK